MTRVLCALLIGGVVGAGLYHMPGVGIWRIAMGGSDFKLDHRFIAAPDIAIHRAGRSQIYWENTIGDTRVDGLETNNRLPRIAATSFQSQLGVQHTVTSQQ